MYPVCCTHDRILLGEDLTECRVRGAISRNARDVACGEKAIRETETQDIALIERLALQARRAMCRAAFTLVELLVVIAIIAILASMLLPALKQAKDQALKIQCLNNQKQLYLYMTMYTESFDEYIVPLIGAYGRIEDDTAGLKAWPSAIATVNGCELDSRGRLSRFWDDRKKSMFFCPSLSDSISNQNDRFDRISYGMLFYGVGAYRNRNTPRTPMKSSQIRRPSDTLFFADSYMTAYLSYFYRMHRSSDNICFIDGHVENEAMWLNVHFFEPNNRVIPTKRPFRYSE